MNCDLLNELAIGLPIHIVSAKIRELQATISYNAIFSDGCQFICKHIDIEIVPSSEKHNMANRKSKDSSQHNRNKETKAPKSMNQYCVTDDDPDSGLSFIANWIEIIISRLTFQAENISITLFDKHSPCLGCQFTLSKINFYNTHPKLIVDSSVNASMQRTSASSLSSGFIGPDRKVWIKLN